MNMRALQRRERRVILIGAAAVLTAALWTRGIPAWREWEDAAFQRSALRDRQLGAARAAVSSMDRLSGEVEAIRDRFVGVADLTLGPATSQGAGAALHELLVGFAMGANLRMSSVQVDVPLERGNAGDAWAPIRGSLVAHGDIRSLTSILDAIEAAPEVIGIIQLDVKPETGLDDPVGERLAIGLVVEALAVATAPSDGG